jgi:hypothetical protein
LTSSQEAQVSDFFDGGGFGHSPRGGNTSRIKSRYQIKRIINGKTYNTETAMVVFETWHPHEASNAGKVLYQTRHGAFFLLEIGHEGEEEGFKLLTDAEAQSFLEKWGATESLEQCFGPFPEGGAAETRWTIRIPGNLAARVEATAKRKDMSVNAYAMRCFERCVAADAKELISEDDLDTFEGWLKYQNFGSVGGDELSALRDLYAEIKAASAATPKIGLMKLRPQPGEHRYAVALRDGANLWLTLWVRRSPKGDVYVFQPRADGRWNPHASYHRDGTLHSKSYDRKFFVRQRQPLNSSFHGTEHIGIFAGHGKGAGAICDPKDFSAVIEIEPGILGPIHGTVAVDLVEPSCEPIDLMMSNHKEVARQEFRDVVPYLVIRVSAEQPAP